MPKDLELLWFLCTVSPIVVLVTRTGKACYKAKAREKAWKNAERYIFADGAPEESPSPEPSTSAALTLDCGDQPLAA